MRTVSAIALALAAATFTSACVSTQEVPLAPNIVRLDTTESGLLFAGKSGSVTLHRAAELTIQNGYQFFKIEQPQVGQGRVYAGTYENGTATGAFTPYGATVSDSGFSVPIYRHVEHVGMTVVMFHAGEPGAQGAFEAATVINK